MPLPLPKGFESIRPQCAAIIITVDSAETFHWNSFQSIAGWLVQHQVPGVIGLDTRHLVHLIRSSDHLLGRVEPQFPEGERYKNIGIDLGPALFYDPGMDEIINYVSRQDRLLLGKGKARIALIDCGVKWNIIRQLMRAECEVELLPWQTDFEAIDCSGWLISNGPGDPTRTGTLKERIQRLLQGERPVLGICLGHQLLSLAAGATTRRMPYGHRSHNQPVYQVGTRKGHITTQNHGYVVEESTLPAGWQPWFKNVNDQTIEGIKHQDKPFCSVQFHPEASGGPRDTAWIIQQFIKEVKAYATR
jgi:carbamoyl-phosphate synthase small subunit